MKVTSLSILPGNIIFRDYRVVLSIYEIIYLFTKHLQNTHILTLKGTREEQQQDEIIFKLFGISSTLVPKLG